jgi:hypothetical protein
MAKFKFTLPVPHGSVTVYWHRFTSAPDDAARFFMYRADGYMQIYLHSFSSNFYSF